MKIENKSKWDEQFATATVDPGWQLTMLLRQNLAEWGGMVDHWWLFLQVRGTIEWLKKHWAMLFYVSQINSCDKPTDFKFYL